jgi:hypothetical protein
VVVSLLALITVKCSHTHPKLGFAVLFILDLAAVVAIAVFSLKGLIEKGENCSLTSILYPFYLGATVLYTLAVLAVLFLPLLWVQRFTNSPGNLVWPVLFFYVAVFWSQPYRWTLVGVGLGTLAVSLLTFVVNVVAGCKGISTTMKSFIKCAWITDLLLMLAAEGVIAWLYVFSRNNNQFSDFSGNQAKTLF